MEDMVKRAETRILDYLRPKGVASLQGRTEKELRTLVADVFTEALGLGVSVWADGIWTGRYLVNATFADTMELTFQICTEWSAEEAAREIAKSLPYRYLKHIK